MRQIQHISPSGLKTFKTNQDEFYLRYLADTKAPSFPQTKAMSVGSAFDAYAKAFLHGRLFGHGNDSAYKFETLFENQVELHNRDFALVAGAKCWEVYKASGALHDLILELNTAASPPRFEFEVKNTIRWDTGYVVLLGRPDVFFINDQGAEVVYDWKVNGYMSSASPTKGFVKSRPDMVAHKDAVPMMFKGIRINAAQPLETCSEEWAAQLATYAWLLGVPVGSTDWVAGIDQLACDPKRIRTVSHRSKVSSEYQKGLFADYVEVWRRATSGHFFAHLTKEESDFRCSSLDQQAIDLNGTGDDKWFADITR